jgi:predicted AlkP superfamily pyrophosphatase or phosphodiesterase
VYILHICTMYLTLSQNTVKMRGLKLIIVMLIVGFSSCVQHSAPNNRPKLVIGLVIDQMRWDYLYRYADLYGNDGFKRLMREGFNCQNTFINYLPSYTGPGHACIYTGSVPAIHGITGNNWIEVKTCNSVYCVDDKTVHQAGDESKAACYSPVNLLTTTITDELKLATNLRSRVYGVALKDRSSILPAGHLANAAYWYSDRTGTFTTSSYYPNQNPAWLQAFNKRRAGDSMVKLGWKLLYSADKYVQSTVDANVYEKGFKGEKAPVFPHVFDTMAEEDRYNVLKSIPAGNTYSIMMARACIEGENLGMGKETDFLALSLSSTDYIGHQFAPNSIEVEDCYLRLDNDIASLLGYLDSRYGKDNYLLFLTADHGGAHNATYLSDMDVPAGVQDVHMKPDLNTYLMGMFGKDRLVLDIVNDQVFLNDSFLTRPGTTGTASNPDREKVKQAVMQWLGKRPEVAYVTDMEDMEKTPLPEPIKQMVINGYNPNRCGVLHFILTPGWYDMGGKTTGSTHGSWNPYDTHIPLLWYGWHVKKGETYNQLNMTDISATLAAMLHIQMPNGCIGKPITEITK